MREALFGDHDCARFREALLKDLLYERDRLRPIVFAGFARESARPGASPSQKRVTSEPRPRSSLAQKDRARSMCKAGVSETHI